MIIKTLTNSLLSTIGIRIQRVPRKSLFRRHSETGEDLVLSNAFSVQSIIDVGVAGGTPWLYRQFPDSDLILVDPLDEVPSLYRMLRGRSFEIHNCAAGASNGTVIINVDKTRPSLSSIKNRSQLTKRDGHEVVEREVVMKTLDKIVAESKFATEKLGLKVDTEGFELDVLKGATETLKRCDFVVCEASIEKRFEQSYDFSELVLYMDKMNFRVSKILSFSQDGNQVIRMADVLFEPR